jgi:hypothetical protein
MNELGPSGRRTVRPCSLELAGAIGFAGSVCVLVGLLHSGSPFTSGAPGAWFFGTAAVSRPSGPGSNAHFLALMLVYVGISVMLGSWFELVRALRRDPGTTLGRPMVIAAAWAIPVLVMPPLFSRDVYSYAAQGEMVSRGINPYVHTPSALGGDSFLRLVDPLWRHSPAPYGPAWERLSGWIVGLSGHDVLTAVIGFRCAALVGVALIAWGVPQLAESVGRSRSVAFALAVLNPLVLLVLLGGSHNDALMLGLLVAGCAVARRNHILMGLVLCSLAAEVKVPALIGAVCIGWWWGESAANWRRQWLRVVAAVLVSAGLMAVVSAVSGLGWRWLSGLSNPGSVVSWLDPVTAVGLVLGHAAHAVGYTGHTDVLVPGSRAVGLAVAAVISVGLIVRSRRVGELQALGWSLLVFVILGPVVWPWYETWGFVFLAVVAEGWTLRLLLFLSAMACFADVPAARDLTGTSPVVSAICWLALAGGLAAYVVIRLLPSAVPPPGRRLPPRQRTSATPPPPVSPPTADVKS